MLSFKPPLKRAVIIDISVNVYNIHIGIQIPWLKLIDWQFPGSCVIRQLSGAKEHKQMNKQMSKINFMIYYIYYAKTEFNKLGFSVYPM